MPSLASVRASSPRAVPASLKSAINPSAVLSHLTAMPMGWRCVSCCSSNGIRLPRSLMLLSKTLLDRVSMNRPASKLLFQGTTNPTIWCPSLSVRVSRSLNSIVRVSSSLILLPLLLRFLVNLLCAVLRQVLAIQLLPRFCGLQIVHVCQPVGSRLCQIMRPDRVVAAC